MEFISIYWNEMHELFQVLSKRTICVETQLIQIIF